MKQTLDTQIEAEMLMLDAPLHRSGCVGKSGNLWDRVPERPASLCPVAIANGGGRAFVVCAWRLRLTTTAGDALGSPWDRSSADLLMFIECMHT